MDAQSSDTEFETNLDAENLPGAVKTMYGLKLKLVSDHSYANTFGKEKKPIEKANTKGRFASTFKTNAGSWMKDKRWFDSANPSLTMQQGNFDRQDLVMLQKRKK